MNDPRWPAYEGWRKMEQTVNTGNGIVTIHYNYNIFTLQADDFKFKE
jgi:hypothetical protein